MAETSEPTTPEDSKCHDLCNQNKWSTDPEKRLSEALKCIVCLAQQVNEARYHFVSDQNPQNEAALNKAEKDLYKEIPQVSKSAGNTSSLLTFAVDLAFERDSEPPHVLYITGVSGYAWTEEGTRSEDMQTLRTTYSSMSSSSETGYPPLTP